MTMSNQSGPVASFLDTVSTPADPLLANASDADGVPMYAPPPQKSTDAAADTGPLPTFTQHPSGDGTMVRTNPSSGALLPGGKVYSAKEAAELLQQAAKRRGSSDQDLAAAMKASHLESDGKGGYNYTGGGGGSDTTPTPTPSPSPPPTPSPSSAPTPSPSSAPTDHGYNYTGQDQGSQMPNNGTQIPGLGVGGGDPAAPGLNIGDIPGAGFGPGPGGSGYGATPGSLYSFLPRNFGSLDQEGRLSAIIGAVTRRQESGLNSSLQGFDAAQQERIGRGEPVRALENKILGDTDVMDEGTIQRLSGRVTSAANNKAITLGRALEDRRAAAGSARSGSAQTEQSAVMQGAMNQAIQAESDIRAQAREKNFASRNAALQAAGGSINQDVRLGAGIAGDRSKTIENAQVLGDSFLSQTLLNPGGAGGAGARPADGSMSVGDPNAGYPPVPVAGNQAPGQGPQPNYSGSSGWPTPQNYTAGQGQPAQAPSPGGMFTAQVNGARLGQRY